MKSKKMTQKTEKEILKQYEQGILSPEIIRNLEEVNQKSIDEIVSIIRKKLYRKQYNLDYMTIPSLRKLVRTKNCLSEAEKEKFLDCNGCSFEEVLDKAQNKITSFERNKAAYQQQREEFLGAIAPTQILEVEKELEKFFVVIPRYRFRHGEIEKGEYICLMPSKEVLNIENAVRQHLVNCFGKDTEVSISEVTSNENKTRTFEIDVCIKRN